MLAPKRIKFRKTFKGKTRGIAQRGNKVSFGEFALMSLDPGWITNRQIEAARVAMTRAMGEEIRYQELTPDQYRGLGFPGAEDMGNMFQFKRDFESYFCGARDPEVARRLNPALQTFAMWLDENKDRIPIG